MMDTNFSLILALILFVVLIGFDLAVYRYRKDHAADNELELHQLVQDAWRRLSEWMAARRAASFRLPVVRETPEESTVTEPAREEPVKEEPAIPARAPELVVSQTSAPQPEDNQTPPASAGRPTVHVQISADIPEGTIVRVTMEVVNAEGKVLLQQQSISSRGYESIMRPSAPAVPVSAESRRPAISFSEIGQWAGIQINRLRSRFPNLQSNLFWGAIIVYALAVSIGIDRFPIYFFTDEAVHMNMIADFLNNGFKNYYGEFMPTFFSAEGWVNGTSVYVQLIPYLIFGKSVVVTRLVSAFITLLGAAAVGVLLKKVLNVKYYWAGILLLVTTPAWFLHSRTAFEYVEVGAFYAMFLYFYGRYRKGDLRSLYFAVFTGALCFYTHGLGEILMGVSGLALFIVDIRYHFQRRQRKTVLLGFGLAILLALPFVRYYLAHPSESTDQVKRRGSYWADTGIPAIQKITNFATQYAYGLNPLYWYFPSSVDLPRHKMLGVFYGNGLWATMPFYLVGLYQIFRGARKAIYRIGIILLLACPILPSSILLGLGDSQVWQVTPTFALSIDTLNIFLWISLALLFAGVILALWTMRKPGYRLALIALLAAPVPASVVAIGMPRMVWMAIPMAIISAIGLSTIVQWVEKVRHVRTAWLAWALFAVLAIVSGSIMTDALVNGPTWFTDYGLYGMQFGASQVFADTVAPELAKDPGVRFVVSPTWANGTEQFVPFFIPVADRTRVSFGQPSDSNVIDALIAGNQKILFIATAAEYNQLVEDQRALDPSKDYSNNKLPLIQGVDPNTDFDKLTVAQKAALPKYKQINIHDVILYPTGQPGFYLISVVPSNHIKEIMAAVHDKNRAPMEDTMIFNGESIRVVHSPLSAGRMEDNFDDNPDTFTRSLEANPYVIYLYPKTPVATHSVFIKTGSLHNYTITIRLYPVGSDQPVIYTQTYQDTRGHDLPPDPEVTINFDKGPELSGRIDIEVKDNLSGETSQIHIRTIQFK